MLQLFTGPFHPSLEKAFLERLKTVKKEPFSKVLVVTPTGRLMEWLQRLLCQTETGYFNVSFSTLNALAPSLFPPENNPHETLISDPSFFDALVKTLIKKHRPFEDLQDQAVPEGFPPSVRGTIRDLQDAGLLKDDPHIAGAIHDAFVGKDADVGSILQLLALYNQYRGWLEANGVFSFSDLMERACEKILSGEIAPPADEILFYGFTDMTGVQFSLFESLAKKASVSFFLPFVKDHPAFEFVVPFWERLIGLSSNHKNLDQPEYRGDFHPREKRKLKSVNVSGLQDEAWAVANEIVRLRETEGIPFDEIAVAARRRSRLGARLPGELKSRGIPFRGSYRRPLTDHPLAAHTLAVLDWLEAPPSRAGLIEFPQSAHFSDQFNSAEEVFLEEPKFSWSEGALKLKKYLEALYRPVDEGAKRAVFEILSCVDEIGRHFDRLSKETDKSEFLDLVREKIKQREVPEAGSSSAGVSLLHAEAARGLSFQAVIVMGMDEKEFPQVQSEDSFLKDDARFALKNIGYRISLKGQSLSEERFLFHLLNQAARKEMILTFQRSDLEGKVVGPSLFTLQWAAEAEEDGVETIVIPRPMGEKLAKGNPAEMDRYDLVRAWLAAGEEKRALSLLDKEEKTLYQRALTVQKAQDSFSDPGPYDGMVSFPGWPAVFRDGAGSASAMEGFATCPFKFFGERILGLKEKKDNLPGMELDPRERGNLVHGFLKDFLEKVLPPGASKASDPFPREVFNESFDRVFSKSAEELRLYPSLWEAFKTKMKKDLEAACVSIFKELAESGFSPASFEEPLEAAFTTGPLSRVPWTGRLDRLDKRNGDLRIVDYKTGKNIPENPIKETVSGRKWQPFLYSEMVRQKNPGSKPHFIYQQVGGKNESASLTPDVSDANREKILNAADTLLGLMEKGAFPIHPDDNYYAERYCDYCDLAGICRKSHGPSAFRSSQGPGQVLADLRKEKPLSSAPKQSKGKKA